jgi:hypothetical protein
MIMWSKLPKIILMLYPIGTWHQARPVVNITSAVPLMYAPPTHVAGIRNIILTVREVPTSVCNMQNVLWQIDITANQCIL